MSAYAELRSRFDRIAQLRGAASMLRWDMQTMMPPGGAEARAAQLATLDVMAHELLADPVVGSWIEEARGDRALSGWEAANVREMARARVHATAVEPSLVAAMSTAGSRCFNAWLSAKPANDWAGFLPRLDEVFRLTRTAADARAAALGMTAYDAMIDTFESGARADDIARVFSVLEAELPGLLDAVVARQEAEGPPLPLVGPFPVDRQAALARRVAQVVGFDFDRGRLDVSAHPFCGGIPDDIRITTRYSAEDFTSALMGVVHETGHALYERNLPSAWRGQPVGEARGMAMHESQSLLVEMQASRSAEFIRFLAPVIQEELRVSGPAFSPENLLGHYRRVERGLIRVDADEVSYPLHVILRFKIERALFDGTLLLGDVPDAWRQMMRSLVGAAPETDREGCMQDVHWTDGAFGYFPCYTLGAIAAAQLFAAACEADASIRPGIAAGDFRPLMAWLTGRVHARASSATTAEILTDATGRSFDAGAFLQHLRRRYLDA